jgi:sugar-specific transcriptional regulator TrmB
MATIELKEVKQNIYDALRELGLSESEIKLYTVSLLLGPSPIANLANHIGISRPNLYKVILGLEKRGLAKFSERKKYTRDFIVESPTVVLEKLRQKRESFDNLDHKVTATMPSLLALYRQGATSTKIKVLEGEEQFVKLFYQILDEAGDQIETFGSFGDFASSFSFERIKDWTKKRAAKGIRVRVLALPGKEAEQLNHRNKEELREARILRGMNPFTTSFSLFANKAVIWQPKTPLAVLIEDEYIVQMLRSMFYALYDRSRTY